MQQLDYKIKSNESKIDSSYLIVGIDIAKQKQYARMTDFNGNELGKKIIFTRDIFGLNQLLIQINTLKLKYNKTSVLVAMEPTGIYWKNIYYGLRNLDNEIETVLVDVKDVITVRKLFYETVKTDTVDSIAIAKTAILKGYKQRLELSEKEQNIKDIVSYREKLVKDSVSIKNMVISILDEVFPEYNKFYNNYFCKSSLILLDTIFCPKDISNIDLEKLYTEIKHKSKTCLSKKKLIQLKELANASVGIKASEGKKMQFKFNIEILKVILSEIDNIEERIAELLSEHEMVKKMMELDGMNLVSAANIISEIGDFNKFKDYKQLISYCGFNLRISESGANKGKTIISKRGNSRLRAYLFRVMLPIIKHNKEFSELHNYYKTRNKNPLKPMQSIVALICKLIRILWGMAKRNTRYNPQLAFRETFVAVA